MAGALRRPAPERGARGPPVLRGRSLALPGDALGVTVRRPGFVGGEGPCQDPASAAEPKGLLPGERAQEPRGAELLRSGWERGGACARRQTPGPGRPVALRSSPPRPAPEVLVRPCRAPLPGATPTATDCDPAGRARAAASMRVPRGGGGGAWLLRVLRAAQGGRPCRAWRAASGSSARGDYEAAFGASVQEPERLWAAAARGVAWHKPWARSMERRGPFATAW